MFLGVAIAAGHGMLLAARMSFLDNGIVRIGMDLELGGAVTFLESHERPGNLINSADLGRQIQMSHYSGPWPFETGDKKPHKAWAGLGWNPIQTGDCYGHPSRILQHRNEGRELYVKCTPMQWPLDNVPGDCVFETWTTLEGPAIHMRFRCTNLRADKTQYRPSPQELPAIYTISKLHRLMTYSGARPYTGDALTHVSNDWHQPWPWTRFVATEGWAALVDDSDWGLGVFKDDGGEFHGGIHGDARSTDPRDSSTAYVAPIHVENFDADIIYEHRTELMLGALEDVRRYFNQIAKKTPPSWRFQVDRQHWTFRDAIDQGFPLKGEWHLTLTDRKPVLESGVRCWRADEAPALFLNLAFRGKPNSLRIFWKRLDDQNPSETKSTTVSVIPDGEYHTYRVDLGAAGEYRGLITGLTLETVAPPAVGEAMMFRYISFTSAEK